jgi:cellulose synthase/poly-beta-1,6-N-acetylglucosamine synthase-like glycosyltransferase
MNWNALLRQVHRWLSIAFTATVTLNIVALVLKRQEVWIGLLAFVPLIPLLLTGLYMFALPYFTKGRVGGRSAQATAGK